ncbi:hypothetical protein [Lactobacillus delbrueckii]|jgi:hypothetical protein|uniref:hypothetical protein n=1 Tax=Lactobacillus delbrueckii TaxID=1584 RepID=UPI003A8865C1
MTAVASFLRFDINTGDLLIPFVLMGISFLDTNEPLVRDTGIFPGLRVSWCVLLHHRLSAGFDPLYCQPFHAQRTYHFAHFPNEDNRCKLSQHFLFG